MYRKALDGSVSSRRIGHLSGRIKSLQLTCVDKAAMDVLEMVYRISDDDEKLSLLDPPPRVQRPASLLPAGLDVVPGY